MSQLAYLGRDKVLAKTQWGASLVVPAYNLDVAVGVIRDGIIEPWTTRLVQELLQDGHHYFNAGANFGYYAVLGGQRVGAGGTVHAVEPNPHILPYLMANVFYGGMPDRINVYRCALGARDGEKAVLSFDPQFLGGGAVHGLRPSTTPMAYTDFASATWSADSIAPLFDEDDRWVLPRGLMVRFEAKIRTIDSICRNGPPLDLIHLDVEGSEPLALLGASETIARSPRVRLITEWWADHFAKASPDVQDAFRHYWSQAEALGIRPRKLLPKMADDGGIFVSDPLDFAHMTETAEHADYVWLQRDQDPWGR